VKSFRVFLTGGPAVTRSSVVVALDGLLDDSTGTLFNSQPQDVPNNASRDRVRVDLLEAKWRMRIGLLEILMIDL